MDRKSSTRPGTGRPETTTQAGPARPDSGAGMPRRNRVRQSRERLRANCRVKDGQAGRITKSAEPSPAPRPVERRSSPRADRGEQWAKYSIILDRNMFSRQRVKPLPPGAVVKERPRVMPNPESYFLLKGVVQENNQFIAFVEDKRTGSVLRLRQGDTVARGLVKSLNLDGLEYQFQDKTIPVTMGSDLEGGSGALTAGDLASYSATAAPAASVRRSRRPPPRTRPKFSSGSWSNGNNNWDSSPGSQTRCIAFGDPPRHSEGEEGETYDAHFQNHSGWHDPGPRHHPAARAHRCDAAEPSGNHRVSAGGAAGRRAPGRSAGPRSCDRSAAGGGSPADRHADCESVLCPGGLCRRPAPRPNPSRWSRTAS